MVSAGFQPIAYAVDRLAVDVSPGIYQLVSRAGPTVDRRTVSMKPGAEYRDLGVRLEFPAVAPLAGTTWANGAHAALAADASRRLAAGWPGTAGLIVMLRSLGNGARPIARSDMNRLTLLDTQLQPRDDVAKAWTVHPDKRAAVWAASLPAGGCCLRIGPADGTGATDDESAIDRSLWLVAGWQTIVFLRTGPAGSTRPAASIHMVRHDELWDPAKPQAGQAIELVAAGLGAGRGIVSDGIVALARHARSPNPVLGLLAAQALLLREQADLTRVDALLDELDHLVPRHPDVLATRWLVEETRAQQAGQQPDLPSQGRESHASEWPPMLLPSYLGLLRLDAYRPGTILGGSVAEYAATTILPGDIWTSWRSISPPDEEEPDADDEQAKEAWRNPVEALAARVSSPTARDELSAAADRVADFLSAVAELDEEDRLGKPPSPLELGLATQLPSATVERAVAEIAALPMPLPPPTSTGPPGEPTKPGDQIQGPWRWPPTVGLSLALAGVLVAGTLAGWQVRGLAPVDSSPEPTLSPEPMPVMEAERVVSFGEAAVNARARQPFVIANAGAGSLTITDLSLTGDDAAAFGLGKRGCRGETLPSRGDCQIRAVFRPARPGLHVAEFQIVSDQLEPYAVVLIGMGQQPGAPRVEASHLIEFGEVRLGAEVEQELTIRNVGSGELTMRTPTIQQVEPDALRVGEDGCTNRSLTAEEACSLRLFFRPVRSGVHVGELQIVPDQAEPFSVALVGIGLQLPGAVFLLETDDSGPVVADQLDFGSLSSGATEHVTVLAMRAQQITAREPAVDPDGFTIDATDCLGRSLEASQTCSLSITFATIVEQRYDMTLVLLSEAGDAYALRVTAEYIALEQAVYGRHARS